jgi:hypothetical protein
MDVSWRRVELEHGELARLRYANETTTLLPVSGAARSVIDAANSIASGRVLSEFTNHVLAVAERVKKGEQFPELIAIEADAGTFILVEGHTRATAYVLSKPSYLIKVLVGSSPLIHQWVYY